jgi:hypothetical protein
MHAISVERDSSFFGKCACTLVARSHAAPDFDFGGFERDGEAVGISDHNPHRGFYAWNRLERHVENDFGPGPVQ